MGDEKQLPSTVISNKARNAGYSLSLFERLKHFNHLLDTQYRMHPSISSFPREYFYHGMVINGENVHSTAHNREWCSDGFLPCMFLNLPSTGEQRDPKTLSIYNEFEAGVVVAMIRDVFTSYLQRSQSMVSIGIITGYTKQVKVICEKV